MLVWVLGAFRDAVIAAVIMSVRGWMALKVITIATSGVRSGSRAWAPLNT